MTSRGGARAAGRRSPSCRDGGRCRRAWTTWLARSRRRPIAWTRAAGRRHQVTVQPSLDGVPRPPIAFIHGGELTRQIPGTFEERAPHGRRGASKNGRQVGEEQDFAGRKWRNGGGPCHELVVRAWRPQELMRLHVEHLRELAKGVELDPAGRPCLLDAKNGQRMDAGPTPEFNLGPAPRFAELAQRGRAGLGVLVDDRRELKAQPWSLVARREDITTNAGSWRFLRSVWIRSESRNQRSTQRPRERCAWAVAGPHWSPHRIFCGVCARPSRALSCGFITGASAMQGQRPDELTNFSGVAFQHLELGALRLRARLVGSAKYYSTWRHLLQHRRDGRGHVALGELGCRMAQGFLHGLEIARLLIDAACR